MDIYREEILDHFKNPRNSGKLKGASVSHKETNASCGDILEMSLKIKDGKVVEVRFEGEGCAVSMAAASMLTEMILGKNLEVLKKMKAVEMEKRLGIKISSGRKKCAALGLVTLKKALEIHIHSGSSHLSRNSRDDSPALKSLAVEPK